VLFERGGLGHAESFAPVRLADPCSGEGRNTESVRITGVTNDHLIGTCL
jgi:hypothetical protein